MNSFNKILKKQDVIALAFGSMIGWGWIILADNWIVDAGLWGAVTALIIGSIAILLIGLTYSELASAMPKTGGEHVYSERALGRNWSFVCTWAIILGYFSVIAFEAIALPDVISYLAPNYKQGLLWNIAGKDVYLTSSLVGMAGVALITWLNIIGISVAALAQKLVTLGIFLAGLLLISGIFYQPDAISTDSLIFSNGFKGVSLVLIAIPFLFVGFDVIPQAAEEVDLPAKSIGKLLMLSIGMAVFWYVAITIAVGLILNSNEISSSSTGLPVADALTKAMGNPIGGYIVVIAGICGILTSWNAFMIGGSRAIYALAHAGLLPAFLAKMHPKYKTPVNAVLLLGALSFFTPLLGRQALVWFVDAGGLGIVIAYILVAISFLVLRFKEPQMPRPFKVANGKMVGIIAIVLSVALFALYLPGSPSALTKEEWVIAGFWTLLGAILYLFSKK